MNNKIFIAVSVLLVMAVSVFFGVQSPGKVPDAVVMGDIVATTAPEKTPTKEEILKSISALISDWKSGNTSAEMVIAQLYELTDNPDADISAAAKDGIALVTVETDAKILFDEAERQYAAGDYMAALGSLAHISPDWANWSKCSVMLDSCKEKVMASIGQPETIEEFEKAVAVLGEYTELVNDADAKKMYDDFADRLAVLRDIDVILSSALEAYDSGNYAESFSALASAVEKYPDETSVIDAYELCTQTYIDDITAKANELREGRQYDEAIALLDEAIEVLNCNEFTTLREDIREDSSFFYRFKKGFHRHFGRFF